MHAPRTVTGLPPSHAVQGGRLLPPQRAVERERMGRHRAIGCGRRNHAETAASRCKRLARLRIYDRSLTRQQGNAAVAAAVLDTVARTAKPISVRIA